MPHPDPRMQLTTKEIDPCRAEPDPKYGRVPGGPCIKGETRDHYPDHHESRWQRPGKG